MFTGKFVEEEEDTKSFLEERRGTRKVDRKNWCYETSVMETRKRANRNGASGRGCDGEDCLLLFFSFLLESMCVCVCMFFFVCVHVCRENVKPWEVVTSRNADILRKG